MVESAREVCASMRMGVKSVWMNEEVKATVRRKESLTVSDEETKERCTEAYREKVKRCIYQSKKKVNEQFVRM